MTTLLTALRRRPDGAPERARPPLRWGIALFLTLTVTYSVLGAVLSLHFNLIDGDGPSRVANAGYVTLSRDPHLGAIGFVWNPLPSLVNIPLLQLTDWWAPLKTRGQAGTIQSALFMAGAALGVRRIAYDHAVPTGWRIVLVVGFAANPMIVQYGGCGMSEAALIMCVVFATRYLMLWLESCHGPDLAFGGIWLGIGYLARYEAVAATAGAVVLAVVWTSYRSRGEPRPRRLAHAVHDAVIAGAPTLVAVAVWALSGWLLTGELFAQFTSQYGNSTQVGTAAKIGALGVRETGTTLEQIANAIFGMQPLVLVIIMVAAVMGLLRRDSVLLAPLAVCGGVLAFEAAAQITGVTFGWFRFYIAVIPLAAILAATFWTRREPSPERATVPIPSWSLGLVALLSLGIAIPVTWQSMLNPAIGNQGIQQGLRSLVHPDTEPRNQNSLFQFFQDDRRLAAYLDDLKLPPASVLTDTFQGWGIWLASNDPQQFVITSDKDFIDALNAPGEFGIRYILVSNPEMDDYQDAINKRYPTIWDDGAKLGTLVLRVVGPNDYERWRIYRVTS